MLFAQHHWPRWGRERLVEFLEQQRDLYGYIHDQTLRLLNKGYVGSETAEQLELPPGLERQWHCHGYYGSLNHNVKAVYQRYLGWFDGNPAHLWPHPPEAAAARYVALAGGADALLDHAGRAFEQGDVVAGTVTIEVLIASGRLAIDGDQAKLGELLGLLDPPDPNFAIVTP